MSYVRHNFILGTYNGAKGIDHDDGSTFWEDTHNLLYIGGQKFKGSNITSAYNLILFPRKFAPVLASGNVNLTPGYVFHSNTIVSGANRPVYFFPQARYNTGLCYSDSFKTYQNAFFIRRPFSLKCCCPRDHPKKVDYETWRGDHGMDVGSKMHSNLPDLDLLLHWAYLKLNMD